MFYMQQHDMSTEEKREILLLTKIRITLDTASLQEVFPSFGENILQTFQSVFPSHKATR